MPATGAVGTLATTDMVFFGLFSGGNYKDPTTVRRNVESIFSLEEKLGGRNRSLVKQGPEKRTPECIHCLKPVGIHKDPAFAIIVFLEQIEQFVGRCPIKCSTRLNMKIVIAVSDSHLEICTHSFSPKQFV